MHEADKNINEKITYVESLLPKEGPTEAASYLGYNDKGKNWYVYSIPFFKDIIAELFHKSELQFYRPTFETASADNKPKNHASLKSKTLDYVFVPATEDQVIEFSRLYDITPIYRRHTKYEMSEIKRLEGALAVERVKLEEELFDLREKMDLEGLSGKKITVIQDEYQELLRKYIQRFGNSRKQMSSRFTIIPKRQMHSLMIVVEGYEHEVDFVTPDELLLQKGDRVRVVSGLCKGVEGILVTTQGSRKGGRVFVSIVLNHGVYTAKVSDECVQVLEFSRATNHVTRSFKAVEALLDECLSTIENGKTLSPYQRASLEFTLLRYACLSNLTVLNEAKLTAFRYVAHTLLLQHDEAKSALQAFVTKTKEVKSYRNNIKRSPAAIEYIQKWKQRLTSLKAS